MILPLAVALGCDLFDSASYAKFANDDRYLLKHRTMHVKELENLPCSCEVCASRDPKDLLDLEKEERCSLVSRHNLWVIRDVIREIRDSIAEGTLWEMVERSAMYNPRMYAAVRRLLEHKDFLEENAPRSTRRFMASSGLSLARPEFTRMDRMMKDHILPYKRGRPLVLTDWTVTHSFNTVERIWKRKPVDLDPFLISPFGLISYEMIDMYPISQSLFPPPGSIDCEMGSYMEEHLPEDIMKSPQIVQWDGKGELPVRSGEIDPRDLGLRKIRSILRAQFGRADAKWSDEIIMPEDANIKIIGSKKTGKIRNVLERTPDGNEVHLLSLRAEDGLFNLRWEAARRIHTASNFPKYRVMVEEGTGEYNAKGYNVFCKFVIDADPAIRAGDDVLIIDSRDELFAVGRAAVSSRMMKEAINGTAVKIRDGAEKVSGLT
jgi:7-cyano-7-deazaguanine tRNA-ribosyltransferase